MGRGRFETAPPQLKTKNTEKKMTIDSDLMEEIIQRIQPDSRRHFPEFGFKKTGGGWVATQGTIDGEKANGHLYHYDNAPYCFVNQKNSTTISLWNYIKRVQGLSNQDTLKALATMAGVALPETGGLSEEALEANRKRESLLEATQVYFTGELLKDGGKEVLKYLKEIRKYTEDEIKNMGLGYYPDPGSLQKHLKEKGHDPETINAAGLKTFGFGTTHKLTIPYRYPTGELKGFICRALSSDVKPKYKNPAGVKMDTPINQDRAGRTKRLTIVEGPLDALISTARGVEGVVATGTSTINAGQVETIKRYGVRDVILCFDSNDKAGAEGTEKALTHLNKHGIRAYVITLPGDHKDPDELLRTGKEGLEIFKELIDRPASAARWKANRILSQYDLTNDPEADEALYEALAYEETLLHPLDAKQFREVIRVALDIPEGELKALTKDYRTKRAEAREVKEYQALSNKVRDMVREIGNGQAGLEDLRQYVNGKIPDIRSLGVAGYVEPYTLDRYLEDLKTSRAGLKTGWRDLDDLIKIPQEAVTIIAGRPSHGKTTFLLNLYLNLIENDPKKTFLYFSYEEGQRRLTSKLITILGETELSPWENVDKVEAKIKDEKLDTVQGIRDACDKFKEYTEASRMLLISEPFYVDELCNTVAHLADRFDVGAVLIDYIQKVKIRGKYPTRQASLQKVSEALVESAIKLKIPFILGAQFNRDVKTMTTMNEVCLREAGDIEQDANLIIGLWNPEKAPEAEMGEVKETYIDKEGNRCTQTLIPDPNELVIKIMKNRDGVAPMWTTLKFNRPILKIKNSKPEVKQV